MVELINEKKRLYKEQRERDRRNRPMTQAEQREYMIKYLKIQGNNWKIGQLKKLKPDELKEEFDKEDHTDVVLVNFQGLLNDLTRDDLKELYRLMMLKYGDSRPEEEYERVLWGDLKTMFDPPSTEDAVWSLTHQQKVLNWRYFHSCAVHCLTLEAVHIYMLTEVKYPLPSRVCQAMLEKRLIGDRKDELAIVLQKAKQIQDFGPTERTMESYSGHPWKGTEKLLFYQKSMRIILRLRYKFKDLLS
ncbi:hypothetical protein Tco_0788170 [Tanacetum coccineum]